MDNMQWDVVVIGGGAAGLSAALLLGRARRRTLVVDAGSPRNRFAGHMHGVLGQEGVPPAELLQRGRAEVSAYGVRITRGTVERVDPSGAGVEVTLHEGEPVQARTVIVATGMTDELPGIPGLAERWGRTVLHCPYCHGWEVADQRLGVLTTSPLGLHQAQLVRQWSDTVTVFTAGLGPLDAAAELRLRSRGIDLVASPVVEVLGASEGIDAVRTADGALTAVDALFTAGTPRPHTAFLDHLGLATTDTPMGRFLAVDGTGRTSNDRIWAAGNVTSAGLTVPMSIGAGALTGGAVNAALVAEDFDRAAAQDHAAGPAPSEYWEHRYTSAERMWSGRVNQVLAEIAADLVPGRALDLGCGEGADAIWLAQHGWTATGIDISGTAIRRATEAARSAGIPADRISFVAADLSTLDEDDRYDLVTASFLHSPVALPRTEILRAAARHVAPGGHLLITGHASAPAWADLPPAHEPRFRTPAEEVEELDLDPAQWTVRVAETRPRRIADPQGHPASIDDSVVLLQHHQHLAADAAAGSAGRRR
ncbi:methyltransferase domain-containing protein [Kocuria sediminis]|uniref:Methyltransferase domain-containing protein n=1 Tax=Kocuria sediminis TaxID=1038857 RepID=A0A6N8GJ50_9MICC|nr:bifunctional NAD(P)/FAD-dependent oxidoreductase/class I SAM-dependent methyltransferase [Kocuria sediminis]MUN63121.1 methyltransferase domain-containing protein [Kocuria sediminis]